MKNLAIIPARSGSKRIKDKNIRNFIDKPILSYPIEILKESGLFQDIIVTTNNEQIANIAKKYGAEIPFYRSEDNSDDYAPLNDVVDEVVEWYKSRNIVYDYVCLVLPTAVLFNTSHLQEGLELIDKGNFESVRPIVPFDYPIQKAFRMTDNEVSFFNPENALKRSQDFENAYHDSGSFYWIKWGSQLKNPNKGAFEIDSLFAHDIDTLEDWDMAEMKYKYIHKNEY